MGLIIISLLFYSLFCGTGLYFLINGISESIELIVLGSILIVIASIVLIVFNYWILFQCRIEFERDCLVYHNILVRGTNRFPKSIYSFVGLLKIDNSIDRMVLQRQILSGSSVTTMIPKAECTIVRPVTTYPNGAGG